MKTSIIQSDLLGEKIHVCEYANGLKAYVIPKPGYTKKYAGYATHYGSIDSEFIAPGETEKTIVPDGIAHFLEHKLFEQEDGNALEKFSIMGSSANAYTSFNHTTYLFSCTDNFEDSFNLLINYVQEPYFTDENVEKEKGIIQQEIRMYEDNPDARVFYNFLGALYHNHPVKKDIAGSVESVSQINKEMLYKCYNTFYHPSNMIVCVVGDVEPTWVFETIWKNQKVKEYKPEIKRIYPDEPLSIKTQYVEQNLDVALPLFILGFKENPRVIGEEVVLHNVGIRILLEMLFGKGSDIYKQLYEDGLITTNFDVEYTYNKGYSYSIIGGESKSPQEVKNRVIQTIERLKTNGLDRENFERVKKMKMGSFLRQFNSVEKIAYEFISNYFVGINFFDFIDGYRTISFEQITEVFKKHFIIENMALSVIKPMKKG